jgi:AcrR family transcriptional regulator
MAAGQGGETTRGAIIEAAYALFIERGYHGATMRDIAARAGITAGSIYNHFADKEQVVQAVILKYHPIVRVLPRLAQVEGATAESLVRDAAGRLIQEVEANPGLLKLAFIELVELGGKHVPELLRAMLPEVQRFLEKVYATGQVRRPPDPLTFVRAFVGSMLGYGITGLLLGQVVDPAGPGRTLDEYVDVFLLGVLDDAARPG